MAWLLIIVTSVNDAPVIYYQSLPFDDETLYVSIAEDPKDQTALTVITVTAVDVDLTEGENLIYSLSGGADRSKFSIDSSSGTLTFSSSPDYDDWGDNDQDNVYLVEVKVSDGNLFDVQIIAVTLTNVDVDD